MTSTVRYVEVRATEVEIVAARIAGVDDEVPVARIPVERTVEIGGIEICSILPVEQDIAQIHIALAPVSTIQVIVCIYTHQVVEVHLVSCLILVFRKIELVSHLVCQEESLLSCLLITHCRSGSECHHEHGYQSYYHSFHNRISLNCYTSCFFFWCKDTMFFASTVGISPKGVGENPYFFILCLRSSIGIEPEWSVKVCVKFFAVFGTIKRNIYYLCTQKKTI